MSNVGKNERGRALHGKGIMKRMLWLLGASLFACALRADVDVNNNGLSDVWEFIYFNGPTDPYADSDQDGVRNYEEMV